MRKRKEKKSPANLKFMCEGQKEHTNNTQACKFIQTNNGIRPAIGRISLRTEKNFQSNDKIFVLKVSNREIRKETRCGKEEWKGNHRKMGRFGGKRVRWGVKGGQ